MSPELGRNKDTAGVQGGAAFRPAETHGSPAVHIRDLTRTFTSDGKTVHALTDVSLDVAHGEFVVLLGPSGCGKSTLLNIIAGLLPATTGTVEVAGQPVFGVPGSIGMMFQKAVLLPWRTVRENILLPIEISEGRRAAAQAQGRADELLGLVGLTGFADRMPNELSGGMQQRAAICRMLITDPQCLLMDEPFGALDEFTREHMNMQMLDLTNRLGRTAILVTHSISEAVFLANRIVVMSARPGRIAGIINVDLPRDRTPDIVTSPAFQHFVEEARRMLHFGYSMEKSA
jgi:NitT/TauT family transport system ATP-binding protein